MKLTKLAIVVALLCVVLVAMGCGSGIAKPTANYVPVGWTQNETVYPENCSECLYSGIMKYSCPDALCYVYIFYGGDIPLPLKGNESSSKALIDMAVVEITSVPISLEALETGTMTISGTLAGYAEYSYTTGDDSLFSMDIVFVKGSTFVDISAHCVDSPERIPEVEALINSVTFN